MRIPPEKLDEIAQANDIVDIISSYTRVKKSGKSFLALCPFHNDKNPSMNVSPEKQVYHCFSCGASGNVFRFVQEYDKITFVEAAQNLAERAGIELNLHSKSPDLSNEISILFEINKAAAKYFHNSLKNLPDGERDFILDYLAKRSIKDDVIKKFGIGYAKKEWEELYNYFAEENHFKAKDVEGAGLITKRDDSNSYYDRFRGRLIFPIFNESGKVVGFGGRKLYEDDKTAKYINSPESKIYNKSRVLYGLNFAREEIRLKDFVILVEGYMDVISMNKAGIKNVVASSGTALTEEQVKLISRYTKDVIFVFDSDVAGIKAAKRGIELTLEAGLNLSIVSLPEGEDPDSIVNKEGKDGFEKHINKKKSVIQFVGDIYNKEDKLSTPEEKTAFVKEIISYVSRMPDRISRAFYVKEIARLYGLYESDIREELETAMKDYKKSSLPKSSVVIPERKKSKASPNEDIPVVEKSLLEIFIKGNTEAVQYLENNLEIDFIKNKTVLKITEYFLDEYINEGEITVSKALNEIEDEDAKYLIASLSIDRHQPSSLGEAEKYNLLSVVKSSGIDIKTAKDVIKQFRIRELEFQRSSLDRNEDSLTEIIRLGKEIDRLKKGV